MALVLSGLISPPVFAVAQPDETTDVLLRGAKKWVEKDRSDLAKNLLTKLILIDPNSQEALYMLGKIELKNGRTDEAQRYLQTLQQNAPDGKRTRELNDAIHGRTPAKIVSTPSIKAAETEPAAKRKIIAETTKAKNPKSSKSKQHQEAKKPDTDEAALSLANDPDIIARTDALDAMADGNLDLAESSLLDILKRRPHDAEVIGGLGLINQKRGKFVEAEQLFAQALGAAKSVKGETGRWESLIVTAKFSQYMTNAKALLDENKLPEAKAAVGQALDLKPDDPDAQAVLGNIKAADNNLVEAERLYRQALKTEGYNVFAARGLASLLARTGRSEEAIEFINQVLHDYQSEWRKSPYSQASLLRAEAELHTKANHPSRAMKVLEKAVEIDPKNPWVRYSLAKLYISLDLAPLARRVMQEGVALDPKDADLLYVRGLILLSLNDYAASIESLNQIPEASLTQDMLDTKNRALMKYYFQLADQELAQGNRKEAIRIMSIAEAQARGDSAATEQVAEGWFRLGQQNQGLSAMRKLPQPVPLQTQVHYASFLNRAKKDQELTDYLPTLRIPDGTDDTAKQYRETIQDIEFAMAGRQYDKLVKAGKKEQAQEFADYILDANHLSSSDYFKFHRSYFYSAKLPDSAISQLNQEKEQNPDDLNIRYELAYAYSQEKQNSNAKRELKELIALTKNDDRDMRLRIASLQQNLGDNSAAKQTLDDLINRFPNNTEVSLQAGYIAKSEGKYNQAMDYFQLTKERAEKTAIPESPRKVAEQTSGPLLDLLPHQTSGFVVAKSVAPPLAKTSDSERIYRAALASDVPQKTTISNSDAANAQRAMDSINDTLSGKLETGIDLQYKTAGSGTSSYYATDIPLLVRFPVGYEAHGTVQVDKIDLNAGALPIADAAIFGKGKPILQPLPQQASGTSVGFGYEQGLVKADIGISGYGFPVSNIVGGIRKGGNIGRFSYSLKLDRRPYTGTLIAYAGAKDPASGITWGGVTSNGVSLYMSTTLSSDLLGNFNVYGIGSYWLLRGQNVQNNDRLWLRAEIDKDIYTTDDMVLNLGLKLTQTNLSKSQAFYTFGHGSYYSPKSSQNAALMLEVSGRENLLSYQVRASASYSYTVTDSALYFPTDAALQQAAGANAVYAGSTGGAFAYGLRALTEYRATPNIAVGGLWNVDRSAYWAPNSLLFYLRYMFKPETGPVSIHPDPVTPYSQY
jgi:Tfp pilus assembly protein PilF